MYPQNRQTSHESGFLRFIAENKLEEKGIPLSKLNRLPESNQIALAFDGNKIMNNITRDVRELDEMATFTSSTSPEVYNSISDICELVNVTMTEYFKSKGVDFQFVLVFNGCGFSPLPDIRLSAPTQPNEVVRFRAYLDATPVRAVPPEVRKLYASRYVIEDDVESMIIRRFHENCKETFRAPYLAWSQISAFFAPSNQYVSDVFGCAELLAFPGVERVITNINSTNMTFDCVSKAAVLSALRKKFPDFSEDDLDSFILYDSKNRLFRVLDTQITLEEFGRLSSQVYGSRAKTFASRYPEEFQQFFRRNVAALDAPVMTKEGRCVFLSTLFGKPKRSVVTNIFGRPLPSIFYYFFMGGPVMPTPFAMLSQGALADNWPTVDTSEYRKMAEIVLPLRVQIVYQLVQYTRHIIKFRWLRQYVVFRLQQGGDRPDRRWSDIQAPPEIALAYWVIDPMMLNPDSTGVYFSDVLPFATRAVVEHTVAKGVDETVAFILLRSLDLLGYFTHATESVEASGPSIFSQALEKFDCPTLSEYGVLLIELIRTGALSDRPLKVSISNTPEFYPSGVRFAARVLSILPLNLLHAWSGPFDPELTAFGCITRLFGKTLRNLTETIAALVFATKATDVPLSEFDNVLGKLPFAFPTEFSNGYLITYILINTQCTINDIKKNFPELYDVEQDLRTAFWFWSMAFEAMRMITEEDVGLNFSLVMDATLLLSEACNRLFPDLWASLFAGIMAEYQASTMVGMMPPEAMPMQMGMMPQQMGNAHF